MSAPAAIAEATTDQPAARVALAAAAAEPFHAYLFAGPRGRRQGATQRGRWRPSCSPPAPPTPPTRAAARSPTPRRTQTSSGCVRRGTQHLVEDIRERVIGQVVYRPFEDERRVFVIEAAEAMAEESQNALLKTLEEPPPFAHLILITAEPEALLETVRSRCQVVRFARLGPDAVEARLEGDGDPAERHAVARLCDGDVLRAAFLLSSRGARAARRGRGPGAGDAHGPARRSPVDRARRGRRRCGRARRGRGPRARRTG